MFARLFVALQYLVPQHLLTALIWRVARIRHAATKNFLIERFVALYKVDIEEVARTVPDEFESFNEFFVRELKDGARPIARDSDAIVSPVDGTVSMAAAIRGDSIIQAKGIDYTLSDLLATDLQEAEAFIDGEFATIYLAPYNYHRVHSPFSGQLKAARYIPGDLFSVNQATVATVDGLFRRNERLILQFHTAQGPAVVIFVGALNVGSITTPWSGEIRPRKRGVVDALTLRNQSTDIGKGDLLGWFNMGSTVIVLFPKGSCEWHDELQPGATVRVGEAIGRTPRNPG